MELLSRANREVCNIIIKDLKTGAPYMKYDLANTTGLNLTSDNVYAMGHGARKVAFQNPLEGELTLSCQCLPYKMLALYSDGIIDQDATYLMTSTIKCATAGELPLAVSDGTIVAGTVFVYPEGQIGDGAIAGTFAGGKFTATTAVDLAVGTSYDVTFAVTRETGVQKIVLNNKRLPKDVSIQMDTFYKQSDGTLIPYRIIVHKATIARNCNLSFSSEGDPQTIDMSFTVLTDDNEDFVDIIEITEETEVNPE